MEIDKKRNRQRANRNGVVINNPFITENVKIVDINNLTDEQKAMPRITKNDYSFVRQPQFEKFFTFAHHQYKQNQVKDDPSTAIFVIGEKPFFKDYESVKEYFTLTMGEVNIDYFCFKYEKGETGNLHLQGYFHYSKPMDSKVVHKIYPSMSLNPCGKQTNTEAIGYCKKKDTQVEGYEFFEVGTPPADERSRTDMKELLTDIRNDMSYDDLMDKYTWLMIQSGDKIEKAKQKHKFKKFQNTFAKSMFAISMENRGQEKQPIVSVF